MATPALPDRLARLIDNELARMPQGWRHAGGSRERKVAFCAAASIAFYNYTDGVSVTKYLQELYEGDDDPSKALYLIMAAVFAYYNDSGEELPIIDRDLSYNMTFQEMTEALKTVLALCNEYYTLPPGEPADEPEGGAKN